jgi:GNAT superfamily N-acetyltransferase
VFQSRQGTLPALVISKNATVVTLRPLDPTSATIRADIAAVDALLQVAYDAPSWGFRVERGLAMQPDGWVVAQDGAGGRIVGCGGFLAFRDGGFGWIGLVATHPDAQRRGVGRAVTQYLVDGLAALGCAAALDGSASGAPLYESMGFRDCGVSMLLTVEDPAGAAKTLVARCASKEVHIRAASLAHLDAILRFDMPYFGASRAVLLHRLLTEFVGRAAIAIDMSGVMRGYVIAQADAIGPLVADDATVRDALLEWALRRKWGAAPRIIVPPDSDHLDAVCDAGFVEQRALRHQRLGIDHLPGNRGGIVAQVSFGEG